MSLEYKAIYIGQELYHHGIKGQKWGIRRFQNPDGSYTADGKNRRRKSIGQKIREHNLKTTKQAHDRANIEQLNYRRMAKLDPNHANYYNDRRERKIDNTYGANYWHESFQNQAKKYIKKYGQEAFDSLNMNTQKVDRGQELVEQAVHDMVEVLNGTMSRKEFNNLYRGTGYRVTY